MESNTSPSRVTVEQNLLRVYLQVLLETRNLRSSSVQFEHSENHLRISFFGQGSEAAGSGAPQKILTAPADTGRQILNFLLDRVSYWPTIDDTSWSSNVGRTKRVLAAPHSRARMLADFTASRAVGGKTSITFSNIVLDGLESVDKLIELNESQTALFTKITKPRTGWVLANTSDKPHMVDGVAVISALRPDACIFKSCSTPEIFRQIVELAANTFVIVGVKHDDPLEMVLQSIGLTVADHALRLRALDILHGAFVHARVRRVCANCARSTPVPPQTIDRLPMQLRPRAKNSYLFGRGCDACGHAAYRGMTGLSSILDIDAQTREMFHQNTSVGDIAKVAYGRGLRCLLEDGIDRIYLGATSFEEVFAVTTSISAAFASAIAAASAGTGSYRVDGLIEGLDGESFFVADENLLGESGAESLTSAAVRMPGKNALKGSPRDSTGFGKRSGERPGGRSATADSGRHRVLIVEDDHDQRAVLEAIFSSEGYEVIGAENGQIALETLQRLSIDLVICDVMMPVLNGAQLLKEIRSQPLLKTIPVLMLTAVENPDVELSLLTIGADDYCEKNVKKKVLLKRAERLLQRRPKNPLEHMLQD